MFIPISTVRLSLTVLAQKSARPHAKMFRVIQIMTAILKTVTAMTVAAVLAADPLSVI